MNQILTFRKAMVEKCPRGCVEDSRNGCEVCNGVGHVVVQPVGLFDNLNGDNVYSCHFTDNPNMRPALVSELDDVIEEKSIRERLQTNPENRVFSAEELEI